MGGVTLPRYPLFAAPQAQRSRRAGEPHCILLASTRHRAFRAEADALSIGERVKCGHGSNAHRPRCAGIVEAEKTALSLVFPRIWVEPQLYPTSASG